MMSLNRIAHFFSVVFQCVKRAFHTKIEPVTHNDVLPADRDDEKEREVNIARSDLAQAIISLERKSWEVRRELANKTLHIVNGGRGW